MRRPRTLTGDGVVIAAFALLLVVGLGAWTYHQVEESLRQIRSSAMRALLDTHVVALKIALEEQLGPLPAASRPARVREVAARYAGAAGRLGESGEVFSFDARGAILNPGHAGETTPLAARIAGASPGGEALDAYANARGAQVVAAWRWIAEHDIGLAIELAAAEAYAPLRYLRIAFGIVFGALVLAVGLALATGMLALRLRSEAGARRAGAYRLEKLIGSGGMANVYLARHDLLKRPCAVKLLKPARATDEIVARFEREVQLASQIAHPNTVEIYDYGRTSDGLFYYAMEYVDGLNLAQAVQRQGGAARSLPVARVVHLLRQICSGLAAAHERGLVHRDVKPENVMVCRQEGARDLVKILDFGLVKSVTAHYSRDLTRNLRILGTPLYMAPERLRNPADVDARADIYAVGAVAFFLLTGKAMFESADDLELTSKVLNEEPPRAAAAAAQAVPVELDLLVQACLEKRREDRPQRALDLVEALDALGAEFPWTQRDAEACWREAADAAPASPAR